MANIFEALFGGAPDYSGALSPEQMDQLKQNAALQGGIGSLVTLLGMSGGQRVPVSTGQALGAALGAGFGGYQSSFDNTLKQMLSAQQLSEYKTKADARGRYQQALKDATTTQPVGTGLSQGGAGSQAQMLAAQTAEFGQEGAQSTIGALMSNPNLPVAKKVNQEKANAAVLDYLREVDPGKYAELTAKTDASTSDMKNYEYAVKQGFKGSFIDYQNTGKAASAAKNYINTADPTAVAKAGMDVTKQYTDLTKDSRERAARWNSLVAASKDPQNPATDATLIYSTAKILDPTGAVQQGDLKTIVGNPSIPQRFQAMAQTLNRGGSLTESQRDDLVSNAYGIIKADEKNISPIVNNYKDFAKSFNVDQAKIESPYKDLQKPLSITVPVGNKRIQAKLAKDGKYYTETNGKYYEVSE